MSIELKQYQDSEGLSDEQMAALLTEKLGRNIGVRGYQIIRARKDAPAAWLEALSIVPHDPTHVQENNPVRGADEGPRDPGGDRDSQVRRAVSDAMLPFEPQTAHTAIVLIYTMAGRGASAVMGAPQVAEVWTGFAPHIATAYIEWAKENETVARIIAAVTLGGAGGKVVMLHASLAVQTLIVADKLSAQMLIPPTLRTDTEEGEDTSVGDGVYPGGDNGSEPGAKPTRKRASRKAAE